MTRPPKTASSLGARLAPGALLLLVIAAFSPTLGFDLLKWDDYVNVTANPNLRPPRLERLADVWTAPYEGLYIPLTYTFFSAEAALSETLGSSGPDPRVYHAGNVLLHAVTVLLVWLLLRRLVSSRTAAGVGAIFFAFHPLQVETVAWVTETKGLLATLFVVVALGLHAGPASTRSWILSTLAFALALLAKPTAAAFPILALVIDRGLLKRNLRESLVRIAPWAALAGGLAVVTKRLQPDPATSAATDLALRPIVALDALGFYATKLVFPFGLAIDYGRTPERALAFGEWPYVGVAVLLVATALSKRAHRASVAFALFVAALLPVLGLVPFGFQFTSTVADRYVYLAMLGPAVLAALAMRSLPGRRGLLLAGVVLLALLVRTSDQIRHWRSDHALFEHAVEVNPDSFQGLDGLGMTLADRGEREAGLRYLDRAVERKPEDPRARINRASVLTELGREEAARVDLAAAAELLPGDPEVAVALGAAAHARGDYDAAETHFRRAIAVRSDFAEAHYRLALCLWTRGDEKAAARTYEAVLRIQPDHFEAHRDLGKLRMNERKAAAAIEHWRRALAIRPDDEEVRGYVKAAEARAPR